jgi:hypothetical protein
MSNGSHDYMAGKDHATNGESWGSAEYLLGVHVIRGRLLSWLPRPLSALLDPILVLPAIWKHTCGNIRAQQLILEASRPPDLKGSKEYRISSANLQKFRSIYQSHTRRGATHCRLVPYPGQLCG